MNLFTHTATRPASNDRTKLVYYKCDAPYSIELSELFQAWAHSKGAVGTFQKTVRGTRRYIALVLTANA